MELSGANIQLQVLYSFVLPIRLQLLLMASPVASAELMKSFELTSMVRGFHIYKEIWSPSLDDRLVCVQDSSNRYDPFVVAGWSGFGSSNFLSLFTSLLNPLKQ